MEWPGPLVRPRPRRCELCGCGRAWQHVRFAPKSMSERSARNEKRSAEVECSVRPYLLPELSNFYCHPGRAGGSPWVISVAHHPYSCAARGGSATPTRRRENRPLLERLSRITSAASSYEIVNSGTFCLKANAKASLGRT